MHGMADGPVAFHYDAPDYEEQLLGRDTSEAMFARSRITARVSPHVRCVAAVFPALLRYSPAVLFGRFDLVVKQVYNAGALSLVIIMVCGSVRRWRAWLAGLLEHVEVQCRGLDRCCAAFALVKELGPVITALLFAGRAGTALASEIGLMKATDQLSAMEMMAVNPMHACTGTAVSRRRHRDAVAGRDFQ